MDGERHRADRAEVVRDVLATDAIAARSADAEAATLIRHRDGEAVDLRLAHHRELLLFEQPCHAGVPGAELLDVEHVAEREHRLAVDDDAEGRGGLARDALRRRVGCDQLGKALLMVDEFAKEAVVLAVPDLGLIKDVIAIVVITDE